MSRRVLVTGGASGLGAALVAEFLHRGDRVLVTDLPDEFGPPPGADYLRLDVTSDTDWAAARAWVEAEFGGLDVLVNNAGIATGGRIDVVSLAEWQGVIDINLLGVVRGCQMFVPMMKSQRSGHIVNTASLAGLVHPPGMASYTAVKAGVVALSETLSYELSPWNIAVSAVCPGFFRTNLASSLNGSDAAVDKIAARLIEKSPYGADQIAAEVMKGIDARRMVIQPDAPGRKAVWTKRFARPVYDREQRRFAARIKAITESMKEDQ
ncbi:MAG TPA: SDR family NAD(P)-dependent oxidoreductase [Aeromicrobium sp.]|nr:SDR family NAD(P)-dependent oxidoreductase [Aeromicrobium sp.]